MERRLRNGSADAAAVFRRLELHAQNVPRSKSMVSVGSWIEETRRLVNDLAYHLPQDVDVGPFTIGDAYFHWTDLERVAECVKLKATLDALLDRLGRAQH